MAMVVPVVLWSSAFLVANHVSALNFQFNRTIYPVNPGLSVWTLHSSYISSVESSALQDPSNWALDVDVRESRS